jgi:glycosyltransferase involved in cell wall biosynthesis
VLVDSLDVNRTSGARANYALIENLSQSFKLTVLHGSETEISLNSIDAIKVKEVKWNWRYILSRTIRLFRRHIGLNLSPFFENKIGFSFTFLSFSHSFQKVLNSLDDSKFNLVFTLSQGESFMPHHTILKAPRFHKNWLAYIHDPYPMACYPKSYAFIGPGTEQKKLFMQAVFDQAKFLSFPSLLLSEWMQKFYRFDRQRVKIIPHQIAQGLNKKSDIRYDSFFDNKKFNILYAGHLLSQRNPLPIIEAFNLFLGKHKNFIDDCQLTFIGPVSSVWTDKLKEFASDQIKFFPPQDFDVTIQFQKQASVNIIIEAIDDESPFLPAKFPHCIFSQKPMLLLSPIKSESRRLLGENFQFISLPSDISSISLNIEQLFKNWKAGKEYKYAEGLVHYLKKEHLCEVVSEILSHGA